MMKKLLGIVPHLIFWAWNGLFIVVVFLALLPIHLAAIMIEAFEGFMPFELFLSTLLVMLVPVAATVAGAVWFRSDRRKLVQLFYGVEAPLFVLALIRLFMIRELTAASSYVLFVFFIGCAFYAWGLWRDASAETTNLLALRTAGHAVGLLVGLYVAALLFFYAVPATAAFLDGFFSFEWLRNMFRAMRFTEAMFALMLLAFMLLFFLSAIVLAVMPAAVTWLYTARWWESFRALSARSGKWIPAAITSGVFIAGITFFELTNRQPQREVFALLENALTTDAERRALLDRQEEIREGLLNAYLAPYRYLSPRETDKHVAQLWRDELGLSEEAGHAVQQVFNVFAQPLLYDGGSIDPDQRTKASHLYEQFFDTPIQKGEREAILRALETTYERDEREAGLLNEGGRKVRVEKQEIKVTERGPYAEVEIHEVYENRTQDQQEILYYFSLPETAAISGLWLGDTDQLEHRFNFTVSPRGAAQSVYKNEVQRRVDPALLEQVGPTQYRLRAFPVPPRTLPRFQQPGEQPKRLHMWLTYVVLPRDGEWPLPQLAEKRNAYFDDDTELFVNGTRADRPSEEEWLPRGVRAIRVPPVQPIDIRLAGELFVRAEPVQGGSIVPSAGRRYAIILDRSFSMARHTEELAELFAWLDERVEKQSDLDLYLTSAPSRGESAQRIDEPRGFNPRTAIYFGGASAGSMLEQFASLRAEKNYDAILVITDGGSLDLATDQKLPRDWGAPLWMIHAGGKIPQGYDDETSAAIERSGGGVTTDVKRAFRQLALAEQYGDRGAFVGFEDGYAWSVVGLTRSRVNDELHAADPVLAKIGARQFIRGAMIVLDMKELATLDRVHAVAKQYGIVSPYSSMIVLIDDRQREALARAEQADDRFDREVESGQEALSTPTIGGFGGSLTATPEPEEWALIAVGLALLYVVYGRRRGALSPIGRQTSLLG